MNRRRQIARFMCGVVVVVTPVITLAQDVTGPALKAAYIQKFVPFTNWPTDVLPAGAPITLCVVGDNAIRVELERISKNVSVEGRSLTVSYAAPDKLPQQCHVMYVSAVTRAQAAAALAPFRARPVLTMSDMEGFNELGGIAELFYRDGALRFSIRQDEAKRSGVNLSSRLLSLAVRR